MGSTPTPGTTLTREDDYRPVFLTPKTERSRRLVYLDEETVNVVRAHRQAQRQERLAAGPAWDGAEYGLVFCDELGSLSLADRFDEGLYRHDGVGASLGVVKVRVVQCHL